MLEKLLIILLAHSRHKEMHKTANVDAALIYIFFCAHQISQFCGIFAITLLCWPCIVSPAHISLFRILPEHSLD